MSLPPFLRILKYAGVLEMAKKVIERGFVTWGDVTNPKGSSYDSYVG